MYSLEISSNVRQKIRLFTQNFQNIYVDLYTDTGIEDEDFIIYSYEKIAFTLLKDIYFEIEKIFSSEILMKKIGEDGILTCSFSVGSFRFVIEFSENLEEKIRFLEDIKIFKK